MNLAASAVRLSVPLVGWALGLTIRAVPLRGQESTTAFVNVSVIPMDRERVIAGQTVVVRGDRIVALGPVDAVPVPANAARVDGRGKYLMPGLGDMHVHFSTVDLTLTADLPRFMLDTASDVADVLFTFVANGVTTVRDMHSGPDGHGRHWLLDVRRRVRSGELLGPRIYAAGDPDESSPEAAAKSVEALKAAGYDFVKFYGRPRPLYDSVVVAARRVGLPVAGHVPERADGGLESVLRDRWASIEHLTGYFAYAIALTRSGKDPNTATPPPSISDAVVRRLAAETRSAGVWNCPTLSTIMESVRAWENKDSAIVNFHLRLVKALHAAGAGLLLGTDATSPGVMEGTFYRGYRIPGGFRIHRELQELVDLGLTPYQALETGTRNVARFLGVEDSAGTVAVGKRADLILLKENPLEDIRNTGAIAGVMIGGRWLPRKELDRRIDTLPSVAKPGAPVDAYGTTAVQLRILRTLLWR